MSSEDTNGLCEYPQRGWGREGTEVGHLSCCSEGEGGCIHPSLGQVIWLFAMYPLRRKAGRSLCKVTKSRMYYNTLHECAGVRRNKPAQKLKEQDFEGTLVSEAFMVRFFMR